MTVRGSGGAESSARPPGADSGETDRAGAARADTQQLILRLRLVDRLRRGAEGPLTVVSAPAGSGKTVLAASWLTSTTAPQSLVHLVVDAGTESPELWSRLTHAVRNLGMRWESPSADLLSPDTASMEALTDAVVTLGPVTVLVDCSGSLPDATWVELDQLLARSSGQLHLVVLVRDDPPPLRLHRHRLAGTLTEIRAADLAFSESEVRQVLEARHLEASPALVRSVVEKTRGWAAGVSFAASKMDEGADPQSGLAGLVGARGDVAEYLLAEVLDGQAEAERDFLLRTGLLTVLEPGLVEAVVGPGGPTVLEHLVRANTFVEEVPASPGAYEYHPLFREFLRAQFAYEEPDSVPVVHRAAARWLAAHGQLAQAIDHAIAGMSWQEAADYIVGDLAIAQLLVERRPGQVLRAISLLPDEESGFAAVLVRAVLALLKGDDDRCGQHTASARALLGDAPAPPPADQELGLALMELVHARALGEWDAALVAAEMAERLLPMQRSDRLSAHPELVGLIESAKGRTLLSMGDFDGAAKAFAAGLRARIADGREYPFLSCMGHQALLAALTGRLQRALSLGQQVERIQSAAGIPQIWCPAAAEVALAWVHVEMFRMDEARRHARRALASGVLDHVARGMLALVMARVADAEGDVDGAVEVLRQARSESTGLPLWISEYLRLEQVSLDRGGVDPADAHTLIDVLPPPVAPAATLILAEAGLVTEADLEASWSALDGRRAPLQITVAYLLFEVRRLIEAGERARALETVERALLKAAPEELRRPFLEATPAVRHLIRSDPALSVTHDWLRGKGDEGARSRAPAARPTNGTSEPAAQPMVDTVSLTRKEREVLGLLAELMSTGEIAARLFVSKNTVRTHVRGILRKLEATKRNEAVRRARDLGIL